jgi:hypothetical protein
LDISEANYHHCSTLILNFLTNQVDHLNSYSNPIQTSLSFDLSAVACVKACGCMPTQIPRLPTHWTLLPTRLQLDNTGLAFAREESDIEVTADHFSLAFGPVLL